MRMGLCGRAAVCGTETVEAPRESPEPRPFGMASLPERVLEAPLPGALRMDLVSIMGASSSVSQLHFRSGTNSC
jgi:hypothetical protein